MINFKKSTKRIFSVLFGVAIACSSFSCNKKKESSVESYEPPVVPQYAEQDFVFYGFWSPYQFTKESYELYKQSGLNTMFFTNHSSEERNSDTLHYLGSNATARSLELCREVGLDAILNYGYWYKELAEGVSFGSTPFSDYNLYSEYKDIIVGMHVADEPNVNQIADFGNDNLTADYKSVYDVPYLINLYPSYAGWKVIGSDGYSAYVQKYADEVVKDFDDNRLLSVDFYPFRTNTFHSGWLFCYNEIAKVAKTTKSMQSYYIQTAVGNEFQSTLGVKEIAMQLNVALAFGADWFGFYCYEMPRDNSDRTPMYEYCMLNPDGTPSPLYYAVQSETARISAFSNVYLAYDWVKTVPVYKNAEQDNQALLMLGEVDFSNTEIKSVKSTEDAIVGCFNSSYGQSFMVVNYTNPSIETNAKVEIEFKNARYVVVYGDGEPTEIIKLENGKLNLELLSGEGRFITVL